MKKFYLPIIGMLMLTAGCFSNKASNSVVPTAPNGTFTGPFARYHHVAGKTGYDTLKGTLTVSINSSIYTYKVSGDTTVHAGSKGTFAYNSAYIVFNDSTFSQAIYNAGVKAKPHLAGQYAYSYDGSTLQLLQEYPLDTLVYEYNLKKQ